MISSVERSPSLVKRYVEQWPDASLRGSWFRVLKRAGVPRGEAQALMSEARPRLGLAAALEVSPDWLAAELPPATAIAWARTEMFDPPDALLWHARGFSSAQAVFVNDLVPLGDERLDEDQCLARERDWRDSGLPPSWVCLCVALDVTIQDAWMILTCAGLEPDLEFRLTEYAAARGADPRSLHVDLAVLLGLEAR